jgi:hypothetical protein
MPGNYCPVGSYGRVCTGDPLLVLVLVGKDMSCPAHTYARRRGSSKEQAIRVQKRWHAHACLLTYLCDRNFLQIYNRRVNVLYMLCMAYGQVNFVKKILISLLPMFFSRKHRIHCCHNLLGMTSSSGFKRQDYAVHCVVQKVLKLHQSSKSTLIKSVADSTFCFHKIILSGCLCFLSTTP